MQPVGTWVGKHRVGIAYALVFILSAIIVFFDFLFGPRIFVFIDMGLDTCDQYFAYYTYLADALSDGDFSIWNFNFGVGIDQYTNQSWVMDPFAWLIVLPGFLAGLDAIRWSVLIVHILKICLLVALFNKYLKYFDVSDFSRVLFSVLYGFNGFMMLWGQHYFFGTAMVYLTALLCVVEWYLHGRTWKSVAAVTLVVFLLAMFSVYTCYMVIVFGVFYAVIRIAYVLPRFKWSGFFKTLYPLVISVVIGICLAGFAFVPTAIGLLTSSGRFESSAPLLERCINALLSFRMGGDWLVLSRFLSNNLLFTQYSDPAVMSSTNYYEFPQMAVTFVFFMLAPQFYAWLFKEERSSRRKTLALIATALIAFYFLSGLFPFVLNAFVAASYRSTFVIVPLLFLVCAIAWDKAVVPARANTTALVVGLLVNMGVLVASAWYTLNHGQTLLLCIAIAMAVGTLVVFALFMVAKSARVQKTARACLVAAACIMLLATAADGYVTNCHRDTWTKDLDYLQEGTYGADTMVAIDYIKQSDPAFYRIEKTYTEMSGTGDSLYQDFSGVTSYNSTLIPGMAKFYSELWPEISTPNGVYQTYWAAPDNPELATLMGIKYLVSRDALDFDWLVEVETPSKCHVYRNVLANSIGTKVYKALTGEQYRETAGSGDHLLDDYVVFDDADMPKDALGSSASSVAGSSDTKLSSDAEPQDSNVLSTSDARGQGVAPTAEEREGIRFANDETFYRENDAFVHGQCSMPQDGYLVLAIPAKSGWVVTVDGQQTELLHGDYGLCTVKLDAGEHRVEARYGVVGLREGVIVSLVGVVAFIVWLALRIRRDGAGSFSRRPKHARR